MPDTKTDIAELRGVLRNAQTRPGGWTERMGVTCEGVVKTCVLTYEDHALMVAAVNNLGPLLDQLEQSQREVERLEQAWLYAEVKPEWVEGLRKRYNKVVDIATQALQDGE